VNHPDIKSARRPRPALVAGAVARAAKAVRSNRLQALTLAALCCALVVAGCANQIRTRHDWDRTVDLSLYRSYAWISDDSLIPPKIGEGDVSYISPIDDQRIRRVVDAEMAEKGYQLVADVESAGLVVSYGIGREEKVDVVESGPRVVGGYPQGYGYGGWYGGSTVQVYRYTEGTLTIELFDRETRQALWIGWGSKQLSDSDDREGVIQTAITKILEPLPLQADRAAPAQAE
jgi:hypothetical protein